MAVSCVSDLSGAAFPCSFGCAVSSAIAFLKKCDMIVINDNDLPFCKDHAVAAGKGF